jgi:glycosyltransferase involved in cell wall biosynthesis
MAGRRVLVLAYYFPPLGGGGVQRTLKFVKYLPPAGYDPVVVTSTGAGHALRDPGLAADIPAGTAVLRARTVPLHVAKWKLEAVLRRLGLPLRVAQGVAWPDEFVGWGPGALVTALRAVRRYRPDVVYSTSSPVTAHAVALAVKRLTGLPWVADFRDAWTLNPEGAHLYEGLSTRLEHAVVRSADRFVVADEGVGIRDVPDDDPRRVVVNNGVDADDVPAATVATPGPRFRLAHVGMLYGERDAAPVLAALRHLVARGAVAREEIELRLVGDARLNERSSAGVPLSRRPYVDHREAVAEMRAADALLLYQPAGWMGASGKIYEYLATGRPILCVASPGNLGSRLVAELGAGLCVAPEDAAGIERAIEQLYRSWSGGGLEPSAEVRAEALRRFSREALARKLAGVLDDAVADHLSGGRER